MAPVSRPASYSDRYGIGGFVAIAAVSVGFAAIAVAPYAAVIVHAAKVIGNA